MERKGDKLTISFDRVVEANGIIVDYSSSNKAIEGADAYQGDFEFSSNSSPKKKKATEKYYIKLDGVKYELVD